MTTINKQISLGTDDCYEINASGFNSATSTLSVGYDSDVYDIGLRWQSVNIPQGASITSAKLSLYLATDFGTLSANIRGIDEDNTVTWASDNRPSQRNKTTATITANEANWNNWATNSWIDIDITSAIQEIVDRGGWSANNDLAVVIEDTAGAGSNIIYVYGYEQTGNLHGAKLDIVYETRTAKLSRATMNVHPGVMFQTITGGHGY
jgi:type IV pilus assembly protein PilY1